MGTSAWAGFSARTGALGRLPNFGGIGLQMHIAQRLAVVQSGFDALARGLMICYLCPLPTGFR